MRVFSMPISSAAIAAALGYVPASAAAVTMQDGSAASPGMYFASDATTGIYNAGNGQVSGKIMGFSQAGKSLMTLQYRSGGGYDNAWLQLGPTTACTSEVTDTYVGTIAPPSINWSGTASRPVGFNIGTWSVTITDTITKTASPVMVELDKIDLYQSGGAVTVNKAMGLRTRFPNPRTGVTVTDNIALTFTDPSGPSGTITNAKFIVIPTMAMTGITTSYGLYYDYMPTGGGINTAAGVDLTIYAGSSTGAGAGNVTVKGYSTILDDRGGRVMLYSAGSKAFELGTVGATAASNGVYLGLSINNTPALFVATTSGTSGLFISSKQNSLNLYTGGNQLNQAAQFAYTSSSVNYHVFTPAATGNAADHSVAGSDSNISLTLTPKGTGIVSSPAAITALSGTAVGAGAATQAFIKASSTTNLGVYYGTGAPGFSAAKGSLYTRTDATTTTTRLYVNTDGSTTWANFTASA